MGADFYSYGMTEANRKTLETFFRYSHRQGFTERELTTEDLFEPSSLDLSEPVA
jgi:4,5-dihydroxyphthalate decarboxylase